MALLKGPEILVGPANYTVMLPEEVTLNCTAINNEDAPNPLSFYWVKDGELLLNPDTSEIEMNRTVVTSQLVLDYESATGVETYQCVVTNRKFEDGAWSSQAFITNCKCCEIS